MLSARAQYWPGQGCLKHSSEEASISRFVRDIDWVEELVLTYTLPAGKEPQLTATRPVYIYLVMLMKDGKVFITGLLEAFDLVSRPVMVSILSCALRAFSSKFEILG